MNQNVTMDWYEESSEDLTKKQRSYKIIFDNVTVPYLMSTLQSIIDFIQDSTSNNLLIREQTPEEIQFLSSVPNFITKESLYALLPQQAQGLVKELGKLIKNNNATLRVVVRRGGGRHKLKDVEIFKKMVNSKGSNNKKSDDLYDIVNKTVEDYDPKKMFLQALSRNNSGRDAHTPPPPPAAKEAAPAHLSWRQNMGVKEHSTSTEKKQSKQNAVASSQSKNNYSLKSNGIKWQAAGTTEDSSDRGGPVKSVANNERRGGRRTVARHSKLLEALAIPLDCVPATRMMQKMGWTGGALGARGEGITEPIMPALNIVQGAGFGHSQPQSRREQRAAATSNKKASRSNSSSTPTEFRITVLENLLQLLKSEDSERNFHLQSAVVRKQIRFIEMALKSLNGRKNVGLNSAEEKELISKIKELYSKSDSIFVEVEYANSYKTVTLIKSEKDIIVKKHSRGSRRGGRSREVYVEHESSDGSSSDAEPETDALVFYSKRDLRTLRAELHKAEPDLRQSSLKTLTSRVAVFKGIQAFVKSDLEIGTIAFQQFKVSKRLKGFLRTCIENINLRAKAKYSTDAENDIYRDILRKNSFKLYAEVLNGRHIELEKNVYRRRKSSRASQTKTDTSKTDEPISDKPQSDTNLDNTEDKTKEYLDSESEMSAISLKDYEVYDINLEESFSDDSDSEKSQSGKVDRPFYDERGSLYDKDNAIAPPCDEKDKQEDRSDKIDLQCDKNKLIQNTNAKSDPTVTDGNKRHCNENDPKSDDKSDSVESDSNHIQELREVRAKYVDKIDRKVNHSVQAKVSDLNSIANASIKNNSEKDTEKLLSLCKDNNFDDFLNNKDAKVSVSIDIKMELNTNSSKILTKQELIEKLENSSDIEIDVGITNDLPTNSKRTSEIFDVTQSSAPKKSKLDFVVAKITTVNNILMTKDIVEGIQREIFSKINENNLPLLKFLSYNDNSVNFRCDNEFSIDWFKNFIEHLVISDTKFSITLSDQVKKTRYKVKASFNCFFDLNSTDLLKKIELYNSNIKVDNWLVLDARSENDLQVFYLDIDADSFMIICDSNFSLYCGIDAIEFSICYD